MTLFCIQRNPRDTCMTSLPRQRDGSHTRIPWEETGTKKFLQIQNEHHKEMFHPGHKQSKKSPQISKPSPLKGPPKPAREAGLRSIGYRPSAQKRDSITPPRNTISLKGEKAIKPLQS